MNEFLVTKNEFDRVELVDGDVPFIKNGVLYLPGLEPDLADHEQ